MTTQETQVKECVRNGLELGLDSWLGEFGFTRRKNALVYVRELPAVIQKIDIAIESHPADKRNATAAIYPWLEVSVDAVERLLPEMLGENLSLLPGLLGETLRQPIEFTSAKAEHARWFLFQPDTVPGVIAELKEFLQVWALPFLNDYCSTEGICEAYDRLDPRVSNVLAQKLRVVAAMLLCGRTADAVIAMGQWFGKAGSRKRYQPVFDYLASRTSGDAIPD